ncbi:adenylate cyclase class 1 [Pseudomonas duriflava]|uniref:Adenylate cyclase class 1 n=1 Tax=Pseudomonas duriflava TaxID=459528 RepID=A0A562QL85_9PSED|nr:class I adenylate cyclase [Pseudomonas duriflava]TWI57522.1 adenylate cyclase class 1 [Pseudomonas duriflava]
MTRISTLSLDDDEGIDRKALKQVRSRFLTVNAGRLARALEGLPPRQQPVLTLLPLLLHVNHPLLPGYVSANTPAGLTGFEPSDEQLAEARRLTRSFAYKPARLSREEPLHGLYLMGSLGTLTQADSSDLDVWLCYDPALPEPALAELQRKCTLLETWAATQGAELHVFLINADLFRLGQRSGLLTSDDCGTAQHLLLLDEFYRTALWLGGRTPIWWQVPISQEPHYDAFTQRLLTQRFLRERDVLDFGHIHTIPAGEYIGAGLWQLFKGIASPYKSVLKLLLTELYADEHPQTETLSRRFKQAVQAGVVDLNRLDPYMLVYQRLEEYLLQRGDTDRLELVRRCLYVKVGKPLSHPPRQGCKSWQRLLMEKLTQAWGWDEHYLRQLDARQDWKVDDVMAERRILVNALTYSYRFLAQFAQQRQAESRIGSRDLNVLGRRLYAAFERKVGKIDYINPGIAPDLAEPILTLIQEEKPFGEEKRYWSLHRGNLTEPESMLRAPLKRAWSLAELLAWGRYNGVIDSATRFTLHAGESDLTPFELNNLTQSLLNSFIERPETVPEEALLRPAAPQEVLLLINVGVDPLYQHSQRNVYLTSDHIDALGYAGMRENLVLTLDQITLNSWNELLVSRFDGPHALLDCLCAYFNDLPEPGDAPTPRLQIRSFCRNRAPLIVERVQTVFDEIRTAFLHEQKTRYLLQIQQGYHLLELRGDQLGHTPLPDRNALLAHLSTPQKAWTPIKLDPHALQGDELSLILPLGRTGSVQVFYRKDSETARVYVLDEHSALWSQQLPFHDEHTLLAPLQRFLNSVQYRRSAQLSLPTGQEPQEAVQYHHIVPPAPQRARYLERRLIDLPLEKVPYYAVQAIVTHDEAGRRLVTLYCDHREFSELEHGTRLYHEVARHILARRRTGERYRCYLTDLDLPQRPGQAPPPTLVYLTLKTELEEALNQAFD